MAGGRVTATFVAAAPVSAIPCSATHGKVMIATTHSAAAAYSKIGFEFDSMK